MGMDIGPESCVLFAKYIESAKTILWNGPAGVFEMDKFAKGSEAIAHSIAKATSNGAYSLIGGGDSVACINKLHLADQVSYISTGGGALLEAIEGKDPAWNGCHGIRRHVLPHKKGFLKREAFFFCRYQSTGKSRK